MTVGCKNPCEDIERLCVCGTCVFMEANEFMVCGHTDNNPEWHDNDHYVSATDKCDLTPSKWRPYWESDAK